MRVEYLNILHVSPHQPLPQRPSLPSANSTMTPPIDDIPTATASAKHHYPPAPPSTLLLSNQKDLALTTSLQTHLSTLLSALHSSRYAQTHTASLHTIASALYFLLTTGLGNRTLGEEYTDIHQVEVGAAGGQGAGRLPSVERRAGYILSSVLLPYGLSRMLPAVRGRVRGWVEGRPGVKRGRVRGYVLENLGGVLSLSPVYAGTLAVFYISGTYYHLSKWVFGLRYVLSKRPREGEGRVGYEVLGMLLVVQMVVQAWMHVRSTIAEAREERGVLEEEVQETDGLLGDTTTETTTTGLLADSRARIGVATHTPLLPVDVPRYDLSDASTLGWLQPKQQRKCTLCLEPMKDPSVTTCGHVFCWTCILDWVNEKPECPLCRQAVLRQHVLPLRG